MLTHVNYAGPLIVGPASSFASLLLAVWLYKALWKCIDLAIKPSVPSSGHAQRGITQLGRRTLSKGLYNNLQTETDTVTYLIKKSQIQARFSVHI